MRRFLFPLVIALEAGGCAVNHYETPAQLMALTSAEVAETYNKGTELTVYEDSFTAEQPLAQVYATMLERTRVCWQMVVVIGGPAHTLDVDPFSADLGYAMFTARYMGRPMVVTQLVPVGPNSTLVKSRAVTDKWRLPVISDWVNQRSTDCFLSVSMKEEDKAARAVDRSRQ